MQDEGARFRKIALMIRLRLFTFTLSACVLGLSITGRAATVGSFENQQDIGLTKRPGSGEYDSTRLAYTISGGGDNMWFTNDAFHFVWKKVSGDFSLAAEIAFSTSGGNAHRKACLLLRQTLDPNSAYADAVLHGDGLTSLQYREAKGAPTREIQANIAAPKRLRLEKHGEYVSMSIARAGEELHPAGGAFRLKLDEPFYVGLGVCAHDNNALETATFTNVELTTNPPSSQRRQLISTLETVVIASTDRRAIYVTTNLIEAPNWSRDGASLLFNTKGLIYRLPATGGDPQVIDTGFANRCNNDHGLSPDGTMLAISDQSQERRSIIYTLPATGGTPQRLTLLGPSYWHGWSPDGKTLAYCGERDGEFDIYTIPAAGGEEKRLTTAKGLDDGPDYSPDGASIYFNSERSGTMQI